jgi:hypothetical protein
MMLHTPVIPALGRLKQEDVKFQASLDYIARPLGREKEILEAKHGLKKKAGERYQKWILHSKEKEARVQSYFTKASISQ